MGVNQTQGDSNFEFMATYQFFKANFCLFVAKHLPKMQPFLSDILF